jgi:hypothetical protein
MYKDVISLPACLLLMSTRIETTDLKTSALPWVFSSLRYAATYAAAGFLAVLAFHLSLISTSLPVPNADKETVRRAIDLLEAKGFEREVFLLRNVVSFRATDHWLNLYIDKESAYAATNVPFGIITLYPDFYTKTADDTERAMILLHEAQHVQMADERAAYAYVWQNRERLGWTQITHGITPTYITVADQTREHSPETFTCSHLVWNDCTETIRIGTNDRPQTASLQK